MSVRDCGRSRLWLCAQQNIGLDIKGSSEARNRFDAGVSGTALQITDIASLHAGFERELFLGQPLLRAPLPDVPAKDLRQIHAAVGEMLTSTSVPLSCHLR